MIEIEAKKCIGCGRCVDICPGNLLFLKETCATIREKKDCWGCCACVKECPVEAICYKLSADLGGAGAQLFAKDEAKKLKWRILKPDGTEMIVEVEKSKANQF